MTARAPARSALSELPALIDGSAAFLAAVYDPETALFPYSTRFDGPAFVNDFRHPATQRYTINTLLGLRAAAAAGRPLPAPIADVDACVERYVALHADSLRNPADLGLLLVLLEGMDALAPARSSALERVAAALPGAGRLTAQDLAWMLWGAVAIARGGDAEAAALAHRLHALMTGDFVDPRSLMPRHSLNPLRRHILSFGGLVYHLRALAEYADLTGDTRSEELFARGVAAALALQGEHGEWPWMIDTRSGAAFDLYPVFGVHQDAMALLFLLPALDRGLPGCAEAIESSLAWSLGDNQLGVRMYVDVPFFAYRSIHRRGRMLRARRFLRSLRPRPAAPVDAARVTLNDECRSYHLGWLLYVWSGRAEAS